MKRLVFYFFDKKYIYIFILLFGASGGGWYSTFGVLVQSGTPLQYPLHAPNMHTYTIIITYVHTVLFTQTYIILLTLD